MNATYFVFSVLMLKSLNCNLNSISPLELALILFILNRPLSSSTDRFMKSISNLGVIFVILINSLLSTLPPALTFLIVFRINGSSYSPEPPSILGLELVYGGSGPLISSSLTPNGLANHRSTSNNSTNGKQQIHNIFGTFSIPIPSSLSQIPFSSSSTGI